MGIFKAYDIRGIVPDELDAELARKIGNAFARHLGARRLVVGRDMRVHSPELTAAVTEGMRDAGATVILPGLTSTPMAYHAIGSLDCDGGLCVTASHNPGEYNGMKLCGPGATPISSANGILDIERMCGEPYPEPVAQRGGIEEVDLLDDYADHVARFADVRRPLRIAIDASNGMAGHTLPKILERLENVEAHTMLMEPDGSFPVHEANPLLDEVLAYVGKFVRETDADLGVCFDGDADRCCFVDNRGRVVSADLITALLAPTFVDAEQSIVYDLRSSWVVKEEIARAGGTPVRDRVGHSFIKATMRGNGAPFGGELSGHFYFAANHTCDSGVIAMCSVLTLLGADEHAGKSLSELVDGLRRYHATGEVNFRVPDKQAAITNLKQRFSDGRQDELDGITVEFGDLASPDWWWFNVRASNTEPLLRLNLEAATPEIRDQRREELVAMLGEPV